MCIQTCFTKLKLKSIFGINDNLSYMQILFYRGRCPKKWKMRHEKKKWGDETQDEKKWGDETQDQKKWGDKT